MTLLRGHLTAVLAVTLAFGAFGAAFALARPTARPSIPSAPSDLPYSTVSHSNRDAVSAFAAAGVRLIPRSKSPAVTTFGTGNDTLEVDVFGEPQQVKAAGFHDYILVDGQYVHFSRTCGHGASSAERWKGNVRVIVRCAASNSASSAAALAQQAEEGLANLKSR